MMHSTNLLLTVGNISMKYILKWLIHGDMWVLQPLGHACTTENNQVRCHMKDIFTD